MIISIRDSEVALIDTYKANNIGLDRILTSTIRDFDNFT